MNDSTKGLISSERVGSAILSRAAPRRGYGPRSAAPAGARDRDRSRRHARPGRLAATVLVVGLLLLGAAAAEAQTAPTVTGVALTSVPDNNTYAVSNRVKATVTFSAAVDITAAPQLELDFDGTAKAAACTTATNTTTMVCEYKVVAGDSAPNGIAIGANTLTGGTIYATGSTTISADLDHVAVAIDANHKVDGILPTLVTTGSEAPRTSTDGTTVILTFSETVVSPDRGGMTIRAGGNVVSTSAASANGPRVDLTLTTALTSSTVVVTVALSFDVVLDTANNGNLAVAATAVTNAVGAPDPPGTLKARRGDGEVHLEWVPVAAVPTDPARAYQLRYGVAGGESNQWRDIPGSAPGGPNARSYTVTGLENGTRYTFDLRVRRDSGFGTAAKIRQTPEAPRWSVSTNRRSVHEGEDVTLSIATRNAVGFYSAPEALTLAVIGEIVLEFATIDGADPEDFEIRVDGTTVQGYTKDITVLNFDKDLDRDPFPAQHFDVEVPVGSTSLDVTVTVLADEEEDGQEHMSFMVFRGEELVNEDTWDGTGVNIESGDAGVVKQLAVADAEATEGEDPSLDFVVTLAPAAAWTVTVDYATHAGTARAGADYTDTSGALTFAPGETAKTVSVPVIDDTVEDTPETLTVKLSNANPPYNEEEGEWEWGSQEAGVLIADAVATGTIRNTEDDDDTDNADDTAQASLTASFGDVPAEHDGQSAFNVRVEFSEDVGISYVTLRDESFSVTDGDVTGARRVDGRHDLWEITVESESREAVTISLPGGRACGTAGAVCTRGDDPRPLSNSPSATVAGPPGVSTVPVTASFSNMPAEHDGSTFTFDLSFSENVAAGYARIRDHAFSVNGATIKKAQRKTQGSNQNWTVTVDPTGNGGVSITLPETTNCSNAGAICTDDGRKLNHSTSDSVQGPVGISVSDARVEEAAGAVLAFAVTLSRSASSPITINYATSDGSATAGADYTAASGILTIESGSSSGSIEVTVLDDSHNDGEETLTLTLSNASSGVLTDATATGTIENHDAMPRALIARVGRTAAVHIVEQVEARVNAPRRPGFDGRVAGREINGKMGREFALDFLQQLGGQAGYGTPMPGTAGQQTRHPGAGGSGLGGTPLNTPGGGMNPAMGGLHSGGMEQLHGDQAGQYGMGMGFQRDRVLSGSEFALNRATSSGGILSFWSRSAQSQFHGRDGVMALNGDVRTTMFGADYSKGRMVTGVSLSHSRGLGNYASVDSGRMTSAVTGLYPWIGYKASDRITVWTVAGYGAGGLLLNPGAGPAIETGLSMAMVAGGGRGQILGDGNGFGLAFKADALWVGTHTKAVNGPGGRLAATDAAVNRLRTALEGSHTLTIGNRMALTPSIEVGIRQDGGDADTGTGMDVGAGLVFADAVTGLSVDVRVRRLVVHQADGFAEHGLSISVSYNPTPTTPLGFTARVSPAWGGDAMSGAEALWGRESMGGMGHESVRGSGGHRLDTEVGYGLPIGSRFVGTPRAGVRTSEYGRDYRIGYGVGVLEQGRLNLQIGVDAERRESALVQMQEPGAGTDQRVLGRATVQW